MLRNPSLILCDEVTSSVDAFAEKDIIETLRSATAERTTVTVAHRLSSIAHSDLIIVLEKGVIAEVGTHRELVQLPDGVYRRMWQAQNEIALSEGREGRTPSPQRSAPARQVDASSSSEEREGEQDEGDELDYSPSSSPSSVHPFGAAWEQERRRRQPRVVRDMQDMNEDYEFNELEEKTHIKSNKEFYH